MRLDHGNDAALTGHARGAEHGSDLDGVMGVVVVDGGAVPLADTTEAPLDAGECGKGRADHLVADARLARGGERGERVQRVVVAEQREREVLELARAALDRGAEIGVEGDAVMIRPEIAQPDIGIARHAICERSATIGGAAELGKKLAHNRVVDAGNSETIERDRLDELLEGLVQRRKRRPIVHMLGVDIGHHPDLSRQLEKGAVKLVGLDHHPVALADPGIGAPGIDDAAGDHRRVEVGALEQIGDQRGRRGLAVRAGDRHGCTGAHQLGQHLGAADDGNAALLGRLEFGVAGLDRARNDEMGGAVDIGGVMADQGLDAMATQALEIGAVLEVAALHG